MVNGILRVTIPPGAGWEWARGPKATTQMRTRARDTLCRMVTDVRPFDPGLRVDRMDFRGLLGYCTLIQALGLPMCLSAFGVLTETHVCQNAPMCRAVERER